MCGIFGTTLQYSPDIIERKLKLMNFRGPDHSGEMKIETPCNSFVTLGHVRLSIIDLDARSNQPFKFNENISIVFNGEIYNYKELRKRHLADVNFKTESDTEVICAMYEKYGIDSVKYFNGMFAYVIYDKKRNVLIGARDRLGKKPFYLWHSNKGFEFASQIKCIAYGNHFDIDDLARKFYLLQGVIPDPYSIYNGIKKLRAGECFTYEIVSNNLRISQYWDVLDNSCGFDVPKSYDEAKEHVRELLYDAVKIRLQADVPVGTFLSGGIDSSLVCAIVSKYNKNLCAYTAKFENREYDESGYAADIAQHLGVPVKVCDCIGEDLLNVFNDYLEYYDEPFADDSLIPTSLVAQKAREDVTVILGGDGGDELFYGYPKYEWTKLRLEQYKKPYLLRKIMSPYYRWRGGDMEVFLSTQKCYSDVYRSLGMFCYDLDSCEKFDRLELAKLQPDQKYIKDTIMSYSNYDIKTFLNMVNQKCDRATMRSSLELRCPLLDYRIVEYSRLIPVDYHNVKYGLKTILKDILYEYVPKEKLDRPKTGFVPPIKDWFRGELRTELCDIVTLENIRSLLPEINEERVITLRNLLIKGEYDNSRMFFTIYTYIKWYKKYFL